MPRMSEIMLCRAIGNSMANEFLEGTLNASSKAKCVGIARRAAIHQQFRAFKPSPTSKLLEKKQFIVTKYKVGCTRMHQLKMNYRAGGTLCSQHRPCWG